jgi:hypothetical protein
METLKITVATILILALTGMCAYGIIKFDMAHPEGRWINCSTAEFNPDFTTEMRQACRKARMSIDKT